jgi:hypothetical protein
MIIKDAFDKLINALRSEKREGRGKEAAQEISRMFFQAVLDRQPVSEPDDRGLRPSAWQGGRPSIGEGWGTGPEVFSAPDGSGFTLRNIAPHIKYFVWSVGGVRQDRLGTMPHRIPTSGYASEVYGHPLVFWWKRMGRVERRHSWVDHPGFTPTDSFVEAAWEAVRPQATSSFRRAVDRIQARIRGIFRG